MRIAAMLSVKSPFLMPMSQDERTKIVARKRAFANNECDNSDFRFLFNVYKSLFDLNANVYYKADFCKTNFLSYAVMQEAKETIESIKLRCKELRFFHTKSGFSYGTVNVNQNSWDLIHACFAGGFHASYIARVDGTYKIQIGSLEEIHPNRSSILSRNFSSDTSVLNRSFANFVIYEDRTKNGREILMNHAAIVSQMSVLLFAGRRLHHIDSDIVSIDQSIEFKLPRLTRDLVIELRNWIENQFMLIVRYPERYGMVHEEGRKISAYLGELLKVL